MPIESILASTLMDNLATKIAQLDALRPTFGDSWVNERIADLHAQAASPPVQQRIEASEGGSVSDAQQASAGGDMRDNALGSGALVLHDIMIAAGGTLVVGATPSGLPPRPAAIQRALAAYLR